MPQILPFRAAKPAAASQPIGAKLQIIALLDPHWVRNLEVLIDWKLSELKQAG